jgi:CRISPR/Cas system-associated protein endoribonuclease Cas2
MGARSLSPLQASRVLLGEPHGKDAENKHLARLLDNLPPAGSVRCMTVTEKQLLPSKRLRQNDGVASEGFGHS